MTDASAPRPPTGLQAKGRKLWRDVTARYGLRVDELRILEDACREADLIDRIEKELTKKGAELVVRGSMGQPVASPLMQEVRQHRNVLAGLLAKLKLPDEGNAESRAEARATSARAAAMARWGVREA